MSVDHWIYKVHDAEMQLIYVGVTRAGPLRLHAHARDSLWAPLAHCILIEHFADRPSALAREAELIRKHCPRFNLQGNPEAYPLEPGDLSVADAAAYARCHSATILKAIRRGELRARRGPRGQIINEEDLRAWIESAPAGK